jgi:hypothetical protein
MGSSSWVGGLRASGPPGRLGICHQQLDALRQFSQSAILTDGIFVTGGDENDEYEGKTFWQDKKL